jgi:hypothetical protein
VKDSFAGVKKFPYSETDDDGGTKQDDLEEPIAMASVSDKGEVGLRECKSGVTGTTTIANAVSIQSTDAQWTSACIVDQLLMDLCEKEEALSADILEELSKKQAFHPGRCVFVLKYRSEFLHVAHLISATDYRYFPVFRIDPRDPSTSVLNEILAVDRETQDMIMMDVIKRILRSNNKLLYLEHIQPNSRHLSWKWEEFDFDLGSDEGDISWMKKRNEKNGKN